MTIKNSSVSEEAESRGEVQEGEIWNIFMAEDEIKSLREGIETPSKEKKKRDQQI